MHIAKAQLDEPCAYSEATHLYRAIKKGKSRKPTGIGYEVWKEVLATRKGRLWFMAAADAAVKHGDLPSDASLVAVIPGFKGKGVGGGTNMKNYIL